MLQRLLGHTTLMMRNRYCQAVGFYDAVEAHKWMIDLSLASLVSPLIRYSILDACDLSTQSHLASNLTGLLPLVYLEPIPKL